MILAYLSVISLISLLRESHPTVVNVLLNAKQLIPIGSIKLEAAAWILFAAMVGVIGVLLLVSQRKRLFIRELIGYNIFLLGAIMLQPLVMSGWIIVLLTVSLIWGALLQDFFAVLQARFDFGKLFAWFTRHPRYVGVLIFAIVTTLYMWFSFFYYDSFRYSIWDMGLFSEVVAKIARGEIPSSTSKGFVHIFQDHFNPVLYVYGWLYRFWSSPKLLLFIQSVTLGLSALCVWLTVRRQSKETTAFLLMLPYILFFGIQYTLEFGFYPESLVVLGFALFFYLLKIKAYQHLVWVIPLMVLGKENGGLYLVMMGLYTAVYHKQKLRGVVMALMGLVWVFIAVKFIIPNFGNELVYHHQFLPFAGTLFDNVKQILANPFVLIGVLAEPVAIKLPTYLYTFAFMFFLPLFNFRYMIFFVIPLLLERFLPSVPVRWGINLHYSLPLTVPLFLAAVETLVSMQDMVVGFFGRVRKVNELLVSGMVVSTILFSYTLPFGHLRDLLHGQLGQNEMNERQLTTVRQLIPSPASILITDKVGVRFSPVQDVYLFTGQKPEDATQDFVLLSTQVGYWPRTADELESDISNFAISPRFKQIYGDRGWYLFKRI